MSRIGRAPIVMPAGVKATVVNNLVTVTGPLGTLSREVSHKLEVNIDGSTIHIVNHHPAADAESKALHGLFRQLVNNMVVGVSKGFAKTLNINGVGYKINLKSNKEAVLNIGYSHTVTLNAPEGITLEAEKNALTVKGIDKEKVGQYASYIRGIKPVEPYHAYGISYSNEVIRRKETKTGKK